MAQRTCEIDGCTGKHRARGMCWQHYKKATGIDRHAITCIVCGMEHQSARRTGKFCSDECRAVEYRVTMRTRDALPAGHPVMTLIAADDRAKRSRIERPKPKPEWRTERECPGCAATFCPLYTSTTVCCSHRCSRKVAKRRRRAREKGALGSWIWSDFMRVARKFNYCCAYCGIKPNRLDPDHVVPLARGGYDSPANLLPACAACNSSKGAMTLNEWAVWRSQRSLPSRVTAWTVGDARYSHLTAALLISPAA